MTKGRSKKREPSNALWISVTIAAFALTFGAVAWRLSDHSTGPNRFGAGPTTGDPAKDVALAALVNSLTPTLKTKLAHGLDTFHSSEAMDVGAGAGRPGLTVTAWIDVECQGSRELISSLDALLRRYPGTFAVDLRGAPRSVDCAEAGALQNVRCLAARARACVSASGDVLEFDRRLSLAPRPSPERIYAAANEQVTRGELDACLSSEATIARVLTDLETARRVRPHKLETPIIVIAGHRASNFQPLLEALILTGGRGAHPAFAVLPNVQHGN